MSRNQRRKRRNSGNSSSGSGGKSAANRHARDTDEQSAGAVVLRSSTETKSSLKTTELIAYAAAVLAVVMTALAVDGDAEGHGDPFGAEAAIRYITYLTIGYMVARGFARSGSHENRIDRGTDLADDDARARTVVLQGEDSRDEEGTDRDGDAQDGDPRDSGDRTDDAAGVDAVAVPSDEAQHAESSTTDRSRDLAVALGAVEARRREGGELVRARPLRRAQLSGSANGGGCVGVACSRRSA